MYTFTQSRNAYILSINNHCEIGAALKQFCIDKDIKAGSVYGIGAVSEATLRFLNPQTKKYVDKTFAEQMEIANLTGNISEKDREVYLHLHLTLGREDYTAIGGHMLTAVINGACELVVVPFDAHLGRRPDEETGLNLYEF